MKKTSWRLSSEAIVFVVSSRLDGERGFLIVSSEKKTYVSDAFKFSGNPIQERELLISNLELNLRISENLKIYAKIDEIDPDKYYKVFNFENSNFNLGYLISNLTIEKGYFKNIFEPIFNTDLPGQVGFVCKELEFLFKDCFNELSRRTTCELTKRTKKWIPGHRYESVDRSFIYLGEFVTSQLTTIISKSGNCYKKEYLTNPVEYPTVYLVINEVDENIKNISEVFNNYYISTVESDKIVPLQKTIPMVDTGEVLVNDIDSDFDLRDYWNTMIENSLKTLMSIDKSGLYSFKIEFISSIYDNSTYYSYGKYLKNDKEDLVINKLIEVTKNIFKYHVIINTSSIDLKGVGYFSIDKSDPKSYLKILDSIFYRTVDRSSLVDKISYYKGYFDNFLKFNYFKEGSNSINYLDFYVSNLKNLTNIEDYIVSINKMKGYYVSRQRYKSTRYSIEAKKIEDLFGKTELTSVILDIIKSSMKDFGKQVSNYQVKDVGTIKSPKVYVSMDITIEDIYNYLDKKVSDELFDNIKLYLFKEIYIEVDKDIDLTELK